jgi:hypothetical protein
MSKPLAPQLGGAPASRAEKMSILSALLGPEGLARLRAGQPDLPSAAPGASLDIDSERAAWHRNKLLERLRDQGRPALGSTASQRPPAPAVRPTTGAPAAASAPDRSSGRGLDMRIAAIADLETLADEHPAIITRLLRNLSRDERIAVLKSLPGPVARTVVTRLR